MKYMRRTLWMARVVKDADGRWELLEHEIEGSCDSGVWSKALGRFKGEGRFLAPAGALCGNCITIRDGNWVTASWTSAGSLISRAVALQTLASQVWSQHNAGLAEAERKRLIEQERLGRLGEASLLCSGAWLAELDRHI